MDGSEIGRVIDVFSGTGTYDVLQVCCWFWDSTVISSGTCIYLEDHGNPFHRTSHQLHVAWTITGAN